MKVKITKVNFHKIYRKNQAKMFKKFFGIKKPCCSISSKKSACKDEFPERDKKDDKDSPSYGHDICDSLTSYGMTSSQIQAITKLDGRLGF